MVETLTRMMTSSIANFSTFFLLNDNKEHEFEKKRKAISVVLLHKHVFFFGQHRIGNKELIKSTNKRLEEKNILHQNSCNNFSLFLYWKVLPKFSSQTYTVLLYFVINCADRWIYQICFFNGRIY